MIPGVILIIRTCHLHVPVAAVLVVGVGAVTGEGVEVVRRVAVREDGTDEVALSRWIMVLRLGR